MPVDRRAVQTGSTLQFRVEGTPVEGTITALIPLPEKFDALRDLATPWAAAWIEVPHAAGQSLQPGQRVENEFLPSAPIVTVTDRALQGGSARPVVQVIRNEHVASVPVRVLGALGTGRTQVSGEFRPGDVAVVESSVPLAVGAFIRFGTTPGAAIETSPPDPDAVGNVANIATPTTTTPARASSVAPIGAPNTRPANQDQDDDPCARASGHPARRATGPRPRQSRGPPGRSGALLTGGGPRSHAVVGMPLRTCVRCVRLGVG